MDGILIGFFAVLLVLLFLGTMGVASRYATPPVSDGMKELSYSIGFWIFGISLLILALISSYSIMQIAVLEPIQNQLVLSSFILLSGIIPYYLIKEALLVRVRFDNICVLKISPWSPSRLRWDQIENVKYDNSWHSFVLTNHSTKIRVSRYMAGLNEFLRVMDSHVSAEVLKDIRKDLDVFLAE